MAKMTIYILPTKTRGCAPQSPETDENDENGGCPSDKTRVYQKQGFRQVWTCPSFFVLFSVLLGLSRGFSRFARGLSGDFTDCPFPLSRPIKSTYEEQSRKGSATQSGPVPRKVGNTRVWKHPGLASLKCSRKTTSLPIFWVFLFCRQPRPLQIWTTWKITPVFRPLCCLPHWTLWGVNFNYFWLFSVELMIGGEPVKKTNRCQIDPLSRGERGGFEGGVRGVCA